MLRKNADLILSSIVELTELFMIYTSRESLKICRKSYEVKLCIKDRMGIPVTSLTLINQKWQFISMIIHIFNCFLN